MSGEDHSPSRDANSSADSVRGTWAEEVTRSERKIKKQATRDNSSSPYADGSVHNLSNSSSTSQDRKISVEFLDEVNEEKFKRLVQEEKIRTPFKRQHDNESGPNSPDSANSDNSKVSNERYFDSKRARPNSQTSSSNSSGYMEADESILLRRQKQIDYGKNTVSYERYIEQVPRADRTTDHPKTPNKYGKYSRRAFDGLVKIWRKQLHYYDPPNEKEQGEIPVSSSDEADKASKDLNNNKLLVQEEKIKTASQRQHENESGPNSPDSANNDNSKVSYERNFRSKRARTNNQTSTSAYVESDFGVLLRRQRQIDYGKYTAEYERYIEQVSRANRSRDHPHTPNKFGNYSRRAFDGLIRRWRRQLHLYDPPNEQETIDIAAVQMIKKMIK